MLQRILLCIVYAVAANYMIGAAASDLTSPQKRAATVDLSHQLVKPAKPESSQVQTDLKNPFFPAGFGGPSLEELAALAAAKAAKSSKPTTDRELLIALAGQLNPTGTLFAGGEPILLFGQKKMKVGDHLSINFDGAPYEVIVSDIQSTNFTVRLNKEEYTRPIQSGKNP